MKDIGEDWIITETNSYGDIWIYRFRGTEQETKEKLVALVLEAKGNDKETFMDGTEDVEDLQFMDNELEAYARFDDYIMNFVAKRFCDVDFI